MSNAIELRLSALRKSCVEPALFLLPAKMESKKAIVEMLAIAAQESEALYRRQHGQGPATGLWQFERGGGVKGVLTHSATSAYAHTACKHFGIEASPDSVWKALEHNDVLAAVFARLLLWSDHRSLPEVGDVEGAWDCYVRNWRPGKPHQSKWAANYASALAAA